MSNDTAILVPPPDSGVQDAETRPAAPSAVPAIDADADKPAQPQESTPIVVKSTKRSDVPWFQIAIIVGVVLMVACVIFFFVAGIISLQQGSCSYTRVNKYKVTTTVDIGRWTLGQGGASVAALVLLPILYLIMSNSDKCGSSTLFTFFCVVCGTCALAFYMNGMVIQFIGLVRSYGSCPMIQQVSLILNATVVGTIALVAIVLVLLCIFC
eukprot:TRINITY_DN26120_c0_g1_i2.p1 TRINITY_DN26120_c0_g1~~TRINITY_DN26120_c0_g1_i2.p1  ORF type:complete len:239 (+),score=50.50 TRINITY_DN26120_c0_g1_i2:87-719(+)